MILGDISDSGFGLVPIKFEGGIRNPDELTWDCWCETCQKKYKEWKAAFDEEQARFK
jgi:hypothetical protein